MKLRSVVVTCMEDFEAVDVRAEDEGFAVLGFEEELVRDELLGMASRSDFCVTPQAFAISLTVWVVGSASPRS